MSPFFIAQVVLTLIVFVALLSSAAGMVYFERKVAALLQQRIGPYLVGPKGLLQPLADVIKLMFKEELRPRAADGVLFVLAPIIAATAAFAAFAVVPFGAETTLLGLLDQPLRLQVADVDVAILVIFAIASMSVYGIVLAGWSSNSKYSLLGGLRSSAQMISYELSYGMALASVLVLANSLSLTDIVNAQSGSWFGFIPRWFVFLQPVGFLIYMTAGIAETIGWVWFLLKVAALLFFYVWMRWTLPRYRYDQLMEFGWKWLLPAAILNLIATAALVIWLG